MPSAVLDDATLNWLKQTLGASHVAIEGNIQSLWNNQGQILRLNSDAPDHPVSVLKAITPNRDANHPRGWDTSASYERKVRSYQVEQNWYEQHAYQCSDDCKVPALLGSCKIESRTYILLEDLSTSYPLEHDFLSVKKALDVLDWLACFHASFLGSTGNGLWEEGSYWHLSTRRDEFDAMPEGALKTAAHRLDSALRESRYQTLIHGDAKVANFLFAADSHAVAAVDFQYVGKGCGMKDVAYFLGSCLSESDCQQHESQLLSHYFNQLERQLVSRLSKIERQALISEWSSLYAVAWTDFYRFLAGWMPRHKKINAYTLTLCEQALTKL